MTPKLFIGQEVWQIVNGFVSNSYIDTILIQKDLISYRLICAPNGFELRKESELFIDRAEVEKILQELTASTN